MFLTQGNLISRDYFTNIEFPCQEISKLDSYSKIVETWIRKIFIQKLKPKYQSLTTTIQGWTTKTI